MGLLIHLTVGLSMAKSLQLFLPLKKVMRFGLEIKGEINIQDCI